MLPLKRSCSLYISSCPTAQTRWNWPGLPWLSPMKVHIWARIARKVMFQWNHWVVGMESDLSSFSYLFCLFFSCSLELFGEPYLFPLWNILALRCFFSRTSSSLVDISVIYMNLCAWTMAVCRGNTDQCLKDML